MAPTPQVLVLGASCRSLFVNEVLHGYSATLFSVRANRLRQDLDHGRRSWHRRELGYHPAKYLSLSQGSSAIESRLATLKFTMKNSETCIPSDFKEIDRTELRIVEDKTHEGRGVCCNGLSEREKPIF